MTQPIRPSSRAWSVTASAALLSLAGAAVILAACSGPGGASHEGLRPSVLQPTNRSNTSPGLPRQPGSVIDLTRPGAVVWQTAPATVETTLHLATPNQITGPWTGAVTDIEEVLEDGEEHERPALPRGLPNSLPVGGINAGGVRPLIGGFFPGLGQTPWTPPDPTLAVGPNHVMATVNMAIAWWTKAGVVQFSSNLDNTGNPGFFESVGCGNFTFDPKCFYDHYAGRWVVIAPETYGSTEAWLCIAVSDDSDPNGTWYKYRTDMVVTVGSNTFWLDYPGFGYDQNAYYITGNLFGLNAGGWGGVAYRVFTKAPLLSGQPAVFSTLRDPNAGSVQVAQAFGNPIAPFFVSTNSSTSLKIQAITNPTTSPTLVTTAVTVPTITGVGSAPSAGGNSVGMIDGRIMNVCWRNGHLYAAHDISNGSGTNVGRWYHMNTNNWPASGSVTLVEAGNIDPGGGKATYFPAVYTNKYGDVGVVVGASTSNDRISVNVAGRRSTDPAGTMGPLTQLRLSGANGGGRWGDYQDIAVDPADDSTFWVIGETAESNGWGTWLDKFTISTQPAPYANDDALGNVFENTVVTADVLANDGHTTGLPIVISTFQATSDHGGVITRSVGTGPGGRDQLTYSPPSGYVGPDSFTYTVKDPNNLTDVGAVTATVLNDSVFRDPDHVTNPDPGLAVSWYAFTSTQASMPNFSSLTPYLDSSVTQINMYNNKFNVMNSGRPDRVGGVFTGYLEVPTKDFYTISLESDDGSRVYIGGQLVLSNDHQATNVEVSGVIGLKPGKHAVRIEYYENSVNATLRLSYASGTLAKTIVPASALWHGGTTCPADFDGSGFVDTEDYDAFIHAFEAGSQSADFDGSGFVDTEDFDAFVHAFEQGC